MKAIIFFLLISISIQAQEDLKYASLNIISNSIIGGIGSGIHKKQNQTFWAAFKQGVWRGSISGALNHGSKKMLQIQAGKENLDWKLCWGSKIVNSFSNAMLYNATMNESNLMANYSINIGFLRLSTKYKVQIDPISLSSSGIILLAGCKFNIKKSLIIGTPIFNYKFKREIYFDGQNYKVKNFRSGISFGQNIITHIIDPNSLANELNPNSVILHELIHTYQRLQYSQINNLFKIYNKYENFKWIHNDLSSFDILYFIQPYKNNIFELEANFFSNLR